jgi:hypothetical protein
MKKKHIFSSNLFKNEDFFKISKTNDYLNYLEKLVEQHFSKTLFDASESAKNTFFVMLPKLKILIKNVLIYRKRTKKSPFKHIRFGRSKSPVKGLMD